MKSFDTSVLVSADSGTNGQAVDFDGVYVSTLVITNNSGVSIQYSADGLSWTTLANGATASPAVPDASSFWVRKLSSGGPAAVRMSWQASDSQATLGASGNGLAAYTGLVATRGFVSNTKHASNKQANVRTAHWARDDITSLQLVLGNYAALSTNGVETGMGGATTFEAAIEYPVGTMKRVTFGGSNQGVAADGATLVSDATAVTIPRGAKFFVRQFIDTAGLLTFFTHTGLTTLTATLGEGADFAVSGSSSKVLAGSYTTATNTNVYPLAIIGTTSRPSVMFIGDSREAGQSDTTDVNGDTGHGPRSLGPSYAYAGSMIPGDRASFFTASNAKRLLLVPYASHIVVELGINDMKGGGLNAVTTLSTLQTLWAAVAAVKQAQAKIYQCTLEPWVASTDSFATVLNQTSDGIEAQRAGLNNTFRTVAQTNLDGYIEVADCIEAGRGSGKWQVTDVANGYTTDGIHPNVFGYMAIARSGAYAKAMGLT